MADINAAKRRLVDALKEKIPRYWELMKNWYKRKISKDEFDSRAKSLLGGSGVQLHNEFLFAILVKCQTVLSGDVPLRRSPVRAVEYTPPAAKQARREPPTNITPFGALESFQYYDPPQALSAGKDLDCLLLCAHELVLPDLSTMHTRMLLGAWEEGLEGVSEEAAELMMLALQHFLKTVITSCISQHSGWQQSSDSSSFKHSFGHGFLSHSALTQQYQTSERNTEADSMHLISRKTQQKRISPITLFHLRNTLQVQGSCIPSHSVRACCRERALSTMWHPSREEEEQKRTVLQWQRSLQHHSSTTHSISNQTLL